MDWSAYWGFLAFAIVLILIPGPDFAVVIKNTLAGGRRRGRFTAAGVGTSNAVQGSAVRGQYDWPGGDRRAERRGVAFGGWRQGFCSNITNPKVIVFYLAVLPQFLRPGAAPAWLLAFAWSHAALSLLYLMAISTGLARARALLSRRRVRRAMDGTTGALLLGFGARLAAEHG